MIDEGAAAIFAPDTLLPSQYFDRVRERTGRSGEHRLMVAVLEDAVSMYLKHAGATSAPHAELFREAEEWIEERDSTWCFSFENVCAVLDLDAEYLRGGLRARKRRALQSQTSGPDAPATDEAPLPAERRRASGE